MCDLKCYNTSVGPPCVRNDGPPPCPGGVPDYYGDDEDDTALIKYKIALGVTSDLR